MPRSLLENRRPIVGIKIHKSLGYGVQNFVPPSSWEETREQIAHCSLKEFGKWFEENLTLIRGDVRESTAKVDLYLFKALLLEIPKKVARGRDLLHYVVFDNEFGLEGILQLIPPCYLNWRRYDDTLDYYEESPNAEPSAPRYVELSHGIYPFLDNETPMIVKGLATYLGIPEIIPNLKPSVYVYWG